MEEKKNILTREGLQRYEDELRELKDVRRKEIAQKIKEAREQGDLSENAEYDAAKDEQRDTEARISELETILKNVEVVDDDDITADKVMVGSTVTIFDIEFSEELTYKIVGSTEVDSLNGKISNESPGGKGLIGAHVGETITVQTPAGESAYKVLDIKAPNR
jgi:transcription elongation factor GreA